MIPKRAPDFKSYQLIYLIETLQHCAASGCTVLLLRRWIDRSNLI